MLLGIPFPMKQETISSLLHYCSKIKELGCGLSLHASAIKSGLASNLVVSNHIVNLYAKCARLSIARKAFDEMSERNLVSWSAMISGYHQAGEHSRAIELFMNMKLVPNEFVYATVFSACSNLEAIKLGKQVHVQAIKYGYNLVSFVSNSLVSMYMECGCCREALLVYNEMMLPNFVSYNALLSGFVENGQGEKGLEVFASMSRQGIFPDRFTFAALFEICSDSGDIKRGFELHGKAIKLKLDSTPFVGNVLIAMYSKFKLLEDAEMAFRSILEKDVVSWNTFIAACCHTAEHEKGLNVFRDMLKDRRRVLPDDFSFTTVLACFAGLAKLRLGKHIHTHLIRRRSYQDIGVENALVNMYAKCGSITYAYRSFKRMLHQNLVSWNTIISAFGNHGLGSRALELFDEMKSRGWRPDSVTLIGVLTACNHAGLVEKGMNLFNSMEEVYGIVPDKEHFSCLIDLLGRAGRLEEAELYMKKYPQYECDSVVLGSLLSACRLHGDKAIGERLGKKLLELHPASSSSPYVLLSSLYASDEMWDGVVEARKLLKGSGMKKEPGFSRIEAEGNFQNFTKGHFHSRKIVG